MQLLMIWRAVHPFTSLHCSINTTQGTAHCCYFWRCCSRCVAQRWVIHTWSLSAACWCGMIELHHGAATVADWVRYKHILMHICTWVADSHADHHHQQQQHRIGVQRMWTSNFTSCACATWGEFFSQCITSAAVAVLQTASLTLLRCCCHYCSCCYFCLLQLSSL